MALVLESPSFRHGQPIPHAHALDHGNVSPALRWHGEPDGTKSFLLVVEDPDAPDPAAPKRTWVHWIVYDLPAGAHALEEDASRAGLPDGAEQGLNDWDDPAWDGPKPPTGRHRYFFKLWALDRALPHRAYHRADLARMIDGHVLDYAELVGTYARH